MSRQAPAYILFSKISATFLVKVVEMGIGSLQAPEYIQKYQPKGIKWSAVPLPCSTFSLVFMGVGRAEAPTVAWLAGWASDLAGWASGLAGWPRGGNRRTDKQTENLPILQDFIPYRGRCPANPHENQGESRAGQGNR